MKNSQSHMIEHKSAKLSPLEVEILKWVKEGKTNEEISIIIGKSKWAVKYHLGNIMKVLEVKNRMQAVKEATKTGELPGEEESTEIFGKEKHKIGIVGCGKGGAAILEMLKDNKIVELVGVADKDPGAHGIFLAKQMKIPIYTEYRDLVEDDLELIIDVTGKPSVFDELLQIKPEKTELMGGISAKLMWQLAEERRKRYEDKERMLKEHENLYHLGLIIENIDSMKDAGYAIIDYATKITNMPAGSLAIFDEKTEDLNLVACKGFSEEFKKKDRWNIPQGGFISKVLNQTYPYFTPNINEFKNSTQLLLKEGVESILAASLTVDGRIVGILFVSDFKKRNLRAEDISLFSLLTVYAALTIERVKSIEEMRRLSIVDGLTGLYNHRYIMEELSKEYQRSVRYNHNFSVLIFDIDNFKQYNDAFGHLEGNKVLKQVSHNFMKNARSTDTVGRFGGEEFFIIVPELNKTEAIKYAERITTAIASYKFPNRKVTVSCGVATYPTDGTILSELVELSDKRLYKAKANGKNQVCS